MIASFLHNYIFIKTKKTASTTVEMTLAPSCGPEDIITPLPRPEEMTRGNGEPLCRNFLSDRALEEEFRDAMRRSDRKGHSRMKKMLRMSGMYFNHMIAADIKSKLAPDFWNGALKITVERHPYERVVSRAYFRFNNDRPFGPYLDRVVRKQNYSSYAFYTIDDQVVVDEFLRQESLHEDLKRLGAKLGIPIPQTLVRAKSKTRADRRPAREILTEKQKEIIYRVCRKEFDLLGYEP
jgi:hypothetical protein